MRIQILACGGLVIALGVVSRQLLSHDDWLGFLHGALTLGGGLVICGLFSLRMRWHGIIGAGVLSLLGAVRGLGNLPTLTTWLAGDRERGSAPILELGITAICSVLLVRVIASLLHERARRRVQ